MDVCDLGASTLDNESNALVAQCRTAKLDNEDTPDLGELKMACALGVTAMPFPADDSGSAQGIVDRDVPGETGVVVAAFDSRANDVYGDLQPGDTVVHGTGPEHKSQLRCQEKSVSIVIEDVDGENVVVSVNGKDQKISIAGFGHTFEISKENGIVFAEEGGAALMLKGGIATLKGSNVFLGENASSPVGHGAPGTASLISKSVLVPVL